MSRVRVPSPALSVSVRHDEENSVYHSDREHESASSLKTWLDCRSLYKIRYVLGQPGESSAALDRGRLAHTALEIGREQCEARLRVVPPEHSTQSGISTSKKTREWLAEQDQSLIWISESDGEFIGYLWQELERNSAAKVLYDSLVHRETSIRWAQDGFRLKCRPDAITADGQVVDYKTHRFVNPLKEFWRNARDYKYGLQSEMYSAGAAAAGFSGLPLLFVLIGTVPPHSVQVVRLPQQLLDIGKRQLDRAISEIEAARLLDDDHDPVGYGEIHELYVPEFALKEE